MIATRVREGKRGKGFKMTRNLERLYKEGKCRDCSVVVTRMDFARILGKFTKVKIQYESSSPKKTSQKNKTEAPSRLKSNENGMVQIHKKTQLHPAKDTVTIRKYVNKHTSRQANTNILKEINVLKNKIPLKDKNSNYNKQIHSNGKRYTIIFNDPICLNNINIKNELSLTDLLPNVNNEILPSEEWCIDHFPKNYEPKNDKVYDRIAAELEDLMYNEKSEIKYPKAETTESKTDEFPSIMDILNDNVTPENQAEPKDHNDSVEVKDNLESNDVEAMLLGKSNDAKTESTPMDVDNPEGNNLMDDVQFNSNEPAAKEPHVSKGADNPHSPSILDEALQKGIEEHLPSNSQVDTTQLQSDTIELQSDTTELQSDTTELQSDTTQSQSNETQLQNDTTELQNDTTELPSDTTELQSDTTLLQSDTTELQSNTTLLRSNCESEAGQVTEQSSEENTETLKNDTLTEETVNEITEENGIKNSLDIPATLKFEDITHVIFKKVVDGKCIKSVTCPKNLKYSIELEEKSVEFLGAPNYISSLDDLQVLLQIVNETDLQSLYVLY